MKNITIITFLLIGISNCALAQKGTTSVGINAGTTIILTESSFYKPGLHLGTMFAYGISREKMML